MNTREILDVLKPLLEEVEANQKMLAELRSKNEQVIETVRLLNQKLLEMEAIKQQNTGALKGTVWADNPQAVEIDALIKRARRLTVREAKALKAVYDAKDNAAEAATAAWDAATAAGDAVCVATAAWDAATTAWYAACALATRDLIDENTPWNQAAYDTLTAPWAKVIGPVHPDDVLTGKDA